PGSRSRPQLAMGLARGLAEACPDRIFWLAGDSAYINASTLQDRPKNLHAVGPLHWKAALYALPEPPQPGRKGGRPRKKGDRLPTPRAMIEDPVSYPAAVQTLVFPKGKRDLRIQGVRDILWYRGCQDQPVVVVLIRDPLGQWRDEALVATDPGVSAEFLILGYCRRWSVELAFFDSKQYLGLHDPRVWSEPSVQRGQPMAWFGGALTMLGNSVAGHEGPQVHRDRRWYQNKVSPTFTDMLGALRLQMWEYEVFGEAGDQVPSPECIAKLLNTLSAVA